MILTCHSDFRAEESQPILAGRVRTLLVGTYLVSMLRNSAPRIPADALPRRPRAAIGALLCVDRLLVQWGIITDSSHEATEVA